MLSIPFFLKGFWSLPISSSFQKFTQYATGIILIFFVVQSGLIYSAQLQPDSGTYISYSIIRTALYPLTIGAFNFLFGSYGLQVLVFCQMTFAIILSYILSSLIEKIFSLNFLSFMFVFGLCLSPLVYGYGNIVLSEGLAYPLFLGAIYCLFSGLFKKNLIHFYMFSGLLLLLCLTRQQYVVLYIIGGLTWSYLLYHRIFSKKSRNNWLISLLSSFILVFITESSYHYAVHDFFGLTPFSGSQMLVSPLYLSNKDDTKYFPSPELQTIHALLIQKLEQKNIIGEASEPKDFNGFSIHYNTMQHLIILPTFSQKTLELHPHLNLTNLTQKVNQATLQMSWILIKKHPIKYLKFYFHIFVNGAGGYYPLFFSLFFLALGIIFSCLSTSIIFPVLVFSILMNLGNTALVSIFEPPLTRYTYGPMLLMYSIFAAFIFYLCTKNKLLVKYFK